MPQWFFQIVFKQPFCIRIYWRSELVRQFIHLHKSRLGFLNLIDDILCFIFSMGRKIEQPKALTNGFSTRQLAHDTRHRIVIPWTNLILVIPMRHRLKWNNLIYTFAHTILCARNQLVSIEMAKIEISPIVVACVKNCFLNKLLPIGKHLLGEKRIARHHIVVHVDG